MNTEPLRLADFIRQHQEPILQAWEDFARTIEPPALLMDKKALRNHASQMLTAIATDLDAFQSYFEQSEKSKGRGSRSTEDSAAETHAVARLLSGYSIEHLVSEYRALRASVLHLWAAASNEGLKTDPVDITRFNEAIDQALAESVKRYATLIKQAQSLFLAILAHDLRNPLGATLTGAEILMLADDLDGKYKSIAASIFYSGDRMSKLVDDLIDYTRTHLGRGLPIAPKPTDAGMLCQRVIEETRLLHPELSVDFTAVGKLEGMWDEGRIAQVISNLLGNALQHGSADHSIMVTAYSAGDEVMVSVSNRGAAIAPERLQSIFEPLVRFAENESLDSPKNQSLGIGLYIAKEVAIAHGGSIDVISSSDSTVFTLRLPRIPPLDQEKNGAFGVGSRLLR